MILYKQFLLGNVSKRQAFYCAVFICMLFYNCASFAKSSNWDLLIKELSSSEVHVQEKTAKQLLVFDKLAIQALIKAAKSTDLDLKLAARKILLDLQLGIRSDTPTGLAGLLRQLPLRNKGINQKIFTQIILYGNKGANSLLKICTEKPLKGKFAASLLKFTETFSYPFQQKELDLLRQNALKSRQELFLNICRRNDPRIHKIYH